MFNHNFKELSEIVINTVLSGKKNWSWAYNSPCKYIMIRVDTRDAKCMLMNRNGDEITIEQLLYQHQGGEWKV
jgi:hypothetical protein